MSQPGSVASHDATVVTDTTHHISIDVDGSSSSSSSSSSPSSTSLSEQPSTTTILTPLQQLQQQLPPSICTQFQNNNGDFTSNITTSGPSTAGSSITQSSLSDRPFLLPFHKQSYDEEKTSSGITGSSTTITTMTTITTTLPPPLPLPTKDHHERHPPKVLQSRYARLFNFNGRPETRSEVIVRSSCPKWIPTGFLFGLRATLFLYAFTVLLSDICLTDRPQFEFCYLTQLSYLGLTSYLG
ncbi:hypothetical protein BX616_005760, partial [Lobosporangium transversale]